jgi:hypothetical protein
MRLFLKDFSRHWQCRRPCQLGKRGFDENFANRLEYALQRFGHVWRIALVHMDHLLSIGSAVCMDGIEIPR